MAATRQSRPATEKALIQAELSPRANIVWGYIKIDSAIVIGVALPRDVVYYSEGNVPRRGAAFARCYCIMVAYLRYFSAGCRIDTISIYNDNLLNISATE